MVRFGFSDLSILIGFVSICLFLEPGCGGCLDVSEDGKKVKIYAEAYDLMDGIRVFLINDHTMGFRSPRGRVGEPVVAESGERLELMWTGFFPRFELLYFKDDEDREPRLIGSCDFRNGCNRCKIFAPDLNGDGIPDRFLRIEWISMDGCRQNYEHKRERIYIFYPRLDALFVCETGNCNLKERLPDPDSKMSDIPFVVDGRIR